MISATFRIIFRSEGSLLILIEVGPGICENPDRMVLHLLHVHCRVLFAHDTLIEAHPRSRVVVNHTLLVHPEDQLGMMLLRVPSAVAV